MQCLRSLGNKVLYILIYEADHSPLAVETPCYELRVRGEDCIGDGRLCSAEDASGRNKISVQLVCHASVHARNHAGKDGQFTSRLLRDEIVASSSSAAGADGMISLAANLPLLSS
jgi:hypothetical protein